MSVEPAFADLLQQLDSSGMPPLSDMSVAQARELARSIDLEGEREPVAEVVDVSIPAQHGAIRARTYRPGADDVPGIVVYFHGGGFVLGDLDFVDATCRRLANRAGVVVASIDYRLAPEHRFPAAVDDAWQALRWVAANGAELGGDATRLAVGGDSAGATLATVTALLARDAGEPALRHQLLVYPVTDFTFSQPSHVDNGEGYFLTAASMRWFRAHYLGDDGDRRDWRASPLLAEDVSGVAPAHIITAEYDPLRDEGASYARRLSESGVPVVHDDYAGVIHGFVNMAAISPTGIDALTRAAKLLHDSMA